MSLDNNTDVVVRRQPLKLFLFTILVNRKWWIVPLLLAGVMVAGSFHLSYQSIITHSYEVATESARNLFQMIKLTRLWNARHGSVYVPVTEEVQPNPYLMIPYRDVETSSGKKLTMINPAFMTRQLSELAMSKQTYPIIFHITSLKPIRSQNSPDEWEAAALQQLQNYKVDEIVERISNSESDIFRYMAALETESACLKCHEEQGYRLGDQRGGISVTFDSKRYFSGDRQRIYQALIQHVSVFVIFALLLLFFLSQIRKQWLLLSNAEQEQKRVIEERTRELQHTNERLVRENQERIALQEQYRTVSDSTFDAIVSCDSAGFIQSWNHAAERMFGYTAAEAVGHNVTLIMPARFHHPHSQAMSRVSMGEPRKVNTPMKVAGRHKNGLEFDVEVSIGQRTEQERIVYNAIIRDISGGG